MRKRHIHMRHTLKQPATGKPTTQTTLEVDLAVCETGMALNEGTPMYDKWVTRACNIRAQLARQAGLPLNEVY